MKGTLHKTENDWVVKYYIMRKSSHAIHPNEYTLPLIDNGHIDGLKLYDSNEGLEVEFEIVSNEGEPLGRGEQPYKQYAKLVDKATRPLTEDDAWLTIKEGDITVNFKPMPEFDEPAFLTRLDQLKEQAWNVIYQEFIKDTDGISSLALLDYLRDNYNPPTKKQDNG